MGILANSVNILEFRVEGEIHEPDLFAWAGDRLARHGFRSIDHSADELSVGWVHLDDFRSGLFDRPNLFWRDHYLVFSLRCDRRRIPGALLKAHLSKAEEEFLASNPGLQRVPRQKKEDLREAVRDALLARSLPTPSIHDVVWDTRTGRIYFTGLGTKTVDLFETLFKQTFEGLRPVLTHPFSRARQVLDAGHQVLLDRSNQAASETALDLIKDNRWLGWDFFLWLMDVAMRGSSEFTVNQTGPAASGEKFVAFLNDRLVLVGGCQEGLQKITVAGPQDNFSEVRAALQSGKQINEANLYLEKEGNSWKMTLKGEMFHFVSFRTPPVKIEKDSLTDPALEKEAVFYEKISLLEEGLQLFDSLYADFLMERLAQEWGERELSVRRWLDG